MKSCRNLLRASAIGLVSLALACVDAAGPGDTGAAASVAGFTPSWISPSWTGGAKGAPSDRKEKDAEQWVGRLCPTTAIELRNHDGVVAGLSLINRCSIPVDLYLCATKGAPPQPAGGLVECAGPDAFQTPPSRLHLAPLPGGAPGRVLLPSTVDLSIQAFFCSDEMRLSGPPLRCV